MKHMQITLSNIKSTAPTWIDGYAKSRGRDADDLRLFVDNADAFKDGDSQGEEDHSRKGGQGQAV